MSNYCQKFKLKISKLLYYKLSKNNIKFWLLTVWPNFFWQNFSHWRRCQNRGRYQTYSICIRFPRCCFSFPCISSLWFIWSRWRRRARPCKYPVFGLFLLYLGNGWTDLVRIWYVGLGWSGALTPLPVSVPRGRQRGGKMVIYEISKFGLYQAGNG